MIASRRPWLVPTADSVAWLSVNPVSALTMAPKFPGAAHGVPVWRDWNTKVGSQGTNRRPATTNAPNVQRALVRRAVSGWPGRASHNSHRPRLANRYRAQYWV